MAEQQHDDLVRDLAALGRATEPALPADRVAAAVMERLPTTVAEPRRPTRTRIALAVGVALLALLAAPPVRAALSDWFGFAGVLVERDSEDHGSAPEPPEVTDDRTLREAAAEATFPIWVPVELGVPQGVTVTDDARVVSMSWRSSADGVVRLDQFDGTLDFTVLKTAPGVSFARVGDTEGVWFEEPHEVVLLAPDGTRRRESARLAGHTLIWQRGVTTLRLEGELDLDRAVAVAESVEPVP